MSDNKLEEKMSDAEMAKREKIVKSMKKNLGDFRKRYGERAKEVMYATATKQAMKEESEMAKQDKEQKKREAEKAAEQSKAAEKVVMDWAKSKKNEETDSDDYKMDKMGRKHKAHKIMKDEEENDEIEVTDADDKKKEMKEAADKLTKKSEQGVAEGSLDQLHSRHKFSFNKTAAGKKREQDRNKEELKQQIKSTKAMGGIAGPKGKLPEELEIEEALKGNQHKIDANKNKKIDAHDFKLLRSKNKAKMEEATAAAKRGYELERSEELPEELEGVAEAAKWRRDDLKGKTWRSKDWDDGELGPDTIPIDRSGKDVDDSGDELTSRPGSWGGKYKRMTKKGTPTQHELGMQNNLKMRMKMQKKQGGLTGPKGKLPEETDLNDSQLDEMGSLDQLHSRHKFVLNKTPAGQAKERARNREELKQQIKTTKLAGPKSKLPEEVEAVYVLSDVYGAGIVQQNEHAEPDADGIVDWYVVEFDHGKEKIFVEDLEIMAAQYEALNKGE